MEQIIPNCVKRMEVAKDILNKQGYDGEEFAQWCKLYNPAPYFLADLNSHVNTWVKIRNEEKIAKLQYSLF
jgi:hypothetical protein